MATKLYGLVEAGGTKFVLGLARDENAVLAHGRIPTTSPTETISQVAQWFTQKAEEFGPIAGFGVASFGPLQLNKETPDWGFVTRTPKAGWSHTNLVGPLISEFNVPLALDTDVNAAAMAEYRWGVAKGSKIAIYITIGTGVGGGVLIDGKPVLGRRHPELGHMRVNLHEADRDFPGVCPAHGTCLEGLASGPAIIARWGKSLSDLPADHIGHEIIAYYLAQAVCNLQSIFEPDRIILGGGVMGTPGLLDKVRSNADRINAEYFATTASEIVKSPGLKTNSGLLGALALISS